MEPTTVLGALVKWFAKQLFEEISNMTQQAILDAIREEREEGAKWVERVGELEISNNELKTSNAELKTLVADLQGMLGSANLNISDLQSKATELEAKVTQLEANQIDAASIIEAVKGIVPTPVSNAVIGEVITNPDIPTPEIVADAPEITPEMVPDAPVVEAALEALEAFESAPAE